LKKIYKIITSMVLMSLLIVGTLVSTASAASAASLLLKGPSNLNATVANGGQINLSWTAPSPVNGYGVSQYYIYRSTDPNSLDLTIIGSAPAAATSYSDTLSVTSGVTYYYRVSATNAYGMGLGAYTYAISHPLKAPNNINAIAVNSSKINLSWTAPSPVDGSGVSQYVIYRSTDPSNITTIIGLPTSTATSYSDTSVTSGTTYYYKVCAKGGSIASMGLGACTYATTP
jgi:fibronectin type 3 domain-containing protein